MYLDVLKKERNSPKESDHLKHLNVSENYQVSSPTNVRWIPPGVKAGRPAIQTPPLLWLSIVRHLLCLISLFL